ncbi:LytS/YhcK type 5TM receptor domain-containing protein [Evansella tamaricis]|uniref:Signal transduction histidine kinase 5TM receptor LytS transmembrane region domain-containing protein n=1 Tax=Evansella tamaricis TaxID=2069301 RepID=A0ABS6J9G5_9BACI|nr:LytS/YhcK type 5TM receptor domain-containing protein [Evansella tamaricis]MBU9710329.1 hypothetical protein [Evansella tamaricis]
MDIGKELFVNLSILISLLFVYSQISKNNPLNRSSSMKTKVLAGVMAGTLGIILLEFSMPIGEMVVDFRFIPLAIVAYYGGAVPTIITTIILVIGAIFRSRFCDLLCGSCNYRCWYLYWSYFHIKTP